MFKLNKSHSRYSKYISTSLDWIRDIPDGWGTGNIRWSARVYSGGTPEKEKLSYWESGTIPWINSGMVNAGFIIEPSAMITEEAFENSSAKWISEGSIVMALAGQGKTKGMVAQLGIRTTCNQSMAAIVPHKPKISRYLFWWLTSNYQNIRNMGGGDNRDGLNLEMVKSVQFPIPNEKEITKISVYLDEKNTLIDEVIVKKQRQIEFLAEHRTALINNAITKGLDKNIEMKDSGVEWIGMIPNGWKIMPLFSEVSENKMKNEGNINNNLLSLSYGKIINKDIENNFGLLPESFENYQIVEEGMIILRLTDLQNDKKSLRVGYVREKGIITSAYTGLVVKSGVSPIFLYQLLHSYDLQKVFYRLGGGVRQGMNYYDLKRLPILVPSLKEQAQIIDYLDKETKYIDAMIVKLKMSIELLKEYKTSLISHAVSGKIKVS